MGYPLLVDSKQFTNKQPITKIKCTSGYFDMGVVWRKRKTPMNVFSFNQYITFMLVFSLYLRYHKLSNSIVYFSFKITTFLVLLLLSLLHYFGHVFTPPIYYLRKLHILDFINSVFVFFLVPISGINRMY